MELKIGLELKLNLSLLPSTALLKSGITLHASTLLEKRSKKTKYNKMFGGDQADLLFILRI